MLIIGNFIFAKTALSQDVSFSQFYANRLYLNPALAGAEKDNRRLFINYRNQWPGLNKAYVSYTASYDQYMDHMHGGFGFRIFNDVQGNGSLQEISLAMDYSYHIQISRSLNINAGLEVNYVQKSIKTTGIILGDMIDPVTGATNLVSSEVLSPYKVQYPDFTFGLAGFYKNYYGGISMSHLFRPSQSIYNNEYSRTPRKLILYLGSYIPIYEKRFGREYIQLSPNIIYQQQENFSQINYGLEALFQNQFIGGIWLRQNLGYRFSSLIFSAGYLTDKFRLRYSYDQQLSSPTVRLPILGAHEISLILTFGTSNKIKHKAIKCPKI